MYSLYLYAISQNIVVRSFQNTESTLQDETGWQNQSHLPNLTPICFNLPYYAKYTNVIKYIGMS